MAKFIIVHEDGGGWDGAGVKGEVYGSKNAAEAAGTSLVNDNVKRAYWVAKVVSRVAAVVTVGAVDEA
jgi:hypothetical protein